MSVTNDEHCQCQQVMAPAPLAMSSGDWNAESAIR
jgi:hypothetical protein